MTMVGRNRPCARPGSCRSPLRRASSFLDKILFWRKELYPQEERHRVVVPNHVVSSATPPEQHPNHGCLGNRIRTTKYTLLSFLPKNLFEQFHRLANLYFLFIVLLNWVPQINAFGKEIAMIPVIFVLGVTAIKDMFEDRRRYKSDKRINNSTCRVFSSSAGRYVKVLWKNVLVGDIVHLSCNELIPADILLLRSSDEQSVCYIETANLDGESNLKQRQVARGLNSQKDSFHPTMFRSTIECDLPNSKIYRFHGSIIQPNGDRVPISKDNLLLRDCVLKNTDFVEGIVVYAGHETKAMLNNGGPRYKRSKLERRMNWDVLWCVVILVVLCFIGATGSGLWLSSFNDTSSVPFIPFDDAALYNPPYEGFLAFWTFVIILQIMIPLSLYVSVEIIKLGQVYHIHNDLELYDTTTNKRLECRALNIPEELGQVEYIFSDKTGTLTENNMIFRRCTIGGVDYNHHHPSVSECASADVYSQRGHYNTESRPNDSEFITNPRLQEELSQMDLQLMICSDNLPVFLTPQSQRIQDFFLLMAVCNTVVVSKHPHQDKMNSSGLYLDSAGNTINGEESPMVKIKKNNHKTRRILATGASPPPSYNSTPLKKHRLLPLPLFGNGRTASPTPSPGELRPIFEAESPDELALATAAYQYNCRLLRRMADSVTLALPGEGLIEFKLLHVLPFDPQRKRMSVLLQHPFTKEKVVFCKGADSAMFSNLAPARTDEMKQMILRTQQHLNNYARKGLRILVMAKKVLTDEEYSTWLALHQEAEYVLEDRDQHIQESACRLETDMELLGATGIEDRLQEGVPETIAALRQAGIVVWVLTGDKQETAVNIAYSCRLFSYDMEIITLNARSKEATDATIKFHLEEIMMDSSSRPSTPSSTWSSASCSVPIGGYRKRGLVIDGHTLAFIIDRDLDRSFLELAQHCHAVLCCRATPIQKASIVKSVKEQLNVLTLAIGDGANDVSMIQTADIGIGISGQEGMQAVMASDFAMSRFRFLERLLLVHGHWCYDRLARMVLYFFYKNAGIIFIIFWFQLYCGFSGMMMIDQLYVMLYNLLFTSLPPLIVGIYDQDAPSELLLSKPELYRLGKHSQIYRSYSFWVNMADALYQSIIIFFIPLLAYHDTTVGIWEFGTTITTCCLSVQLLHLCIESKSWTALHLAAMVISVVVYFGFGLAYNAVCISCKDLPNPYWVMQQTMGTTIFWLNVLLISVAALLPRLVSRLLQQTLWPSDVTMALLAEKDDQIPEEGEFSVAWSRSTSVSSVLRIGETYNQPFRPAQGTLTEVA